MNIDVSPIKSSQLTDKKERTLVESSTFLRIRILGALSLFQLIDSLDKEHFFVQQEGGIIEELVFHRYLENEALQTSTVRTNNLFQYQLINMMTACEQISLAEAKQMQYSLFHISRLILRYNACAAPDRIQYIAKKEKPKLQLGIVGGSSYSAIGFGTGFPLSLQSIKYELAPGYLAGLGFMIQLPRNLGRNTFRIEGLFHQRRFKAQWGPDNNSAFSIPNLQINLMYQWRMTLKKVNPFFGGGISPFIPLKQLELNTSSIGLWAAQYVSNENRSGVACFLNGGIFYKNLYIDLRYSYYLNPKIVLLGELGVLNESSLQICLAWFLL